MSRLRRLEITGKIFFITCNVKQKTKTLSPNERTLLLRVTGDLRVRWGFRLFAYGVLPSHWHALIEPAPQHTISGVLHEIKRVSALQINRRRGATGPLWQARFYDRFLRRARDFRETFAYIHANPVRDGFVRHPGAWPWSSYRCYFGGGACLLAVDPIDVPLDDRARI